MKHFKVSLLITTFNWPEALDLVLQSVTKQTCLPSQIVIADDGSQTDTDSVVSRYKEDLPIEITWQPDRDFRAARARNLALLRTKHDYVIFIDGDCLLPPNFVQNHLALAKPGKIVSGNRALLSRHETNLLLHKERRMDTNRLFSGYKYRAMPFGPLRDIDPSSWQSVRSCNFGAHTADIIRIGGFDESYVGWGREDSDFVARMLKAGITIRSGRFATCVAHLFHPERSRDQFSVNDDKFKKLLSSDTSYQPTKTVIKGK